MAASRISVAFLLALMLPSGLLAQASPDWFGTWHLDIARSTFIGPTPYARGTWAVERRDGDGVFMVYHQVGVRGGVTHMEWTGRFDGADHRMHGPDALVTYAYAFVDEHTLDLVVKVDGRPAATSRVVLAPDGQTVTATTENSTARGVVTTTTTYAKTR